MSEPIRLVNNRPSTFLSPDVFVEHAGDAVHVYQAAGDKLVLRGAVDLGGVRETDAEARRRWPSRRNYTIFVVAVTMLVCWIVGYLDEARAHADSCQYLGDRYNVQYDCTQNQPWLPYGTANNPPLSGPNPATLCSQPMHQHDMACTG